MTTTTPEEPTLAERTAALREDAARLVLRVPKGAPKYRGAAAALRTVQTMVYSPTGPGPLWTHLQTAIELLEAQGGA